MYIKGSNICVILIGYPVILAFISIDNILYVVHLETLFSLTKKIRYEIRLYGDSNGIMFMSHYTIVFHQCCITPSVDFLQS